MTIRIFPSRLPGELLETHEHGTITLHNWLTKNVKNYYTDGPQPIAVEIDSRPVSPSEWPLCQVVHDSDVKIYPVPYAAGFAIASLIIAVASAVYSIYMMNNLDTGGYTSSNGIGLDLNPAKANNARLGDAIRELFARTTSLSSPR
ncbi:Uncharacterised protein [Raoultella terrigena]|uniref:hypothetical protein n=1 Tax=Raoultella terrigena TaxID=577 RepID=UPI000DFD328B|nr:hypothetical protein [Raoultella terrigena]SUQ58567.1 Uncharacterised protein [Raoultella terrigena]